jgi:hypothetical protein
MIFDKLLEQDSRFAALFPYTNITHDILQGGTRVRATYLQINNRHLNTLLHATPTSTTPTQPCPSDNADATGDLFSLLPSPPKGGRGGVGGAHQRAPGEMK